MDLEKKELQEKYKEVSGKNPALAWDIPKLKQKIQEAQDDSNGILKPTKKEYEVFNGIEINPNKTYEFRLIGVESPQVIIPREAPCWDIDSESERVIRVSDTEESPYVDEQGSEKSTANPIVFTKGVLVVDGKKKSLIKYLLAFDGYDKKSQVLPQNTNIAKLYTLYNADEVAKAKLKREDDIFEARKVVEDSNTEALKNYLRSVYLLPVDEMETTAIKLEAIQKAKEDPKGFIKDFTNPIHKVKADIQKGFTKGELSDKEGVVKWDKTNVIIMTIDAKVERADHTLAKWVVAGSKEAKEFYSLLETKI